MYRLLLTTAIITLAIIQSLSGPLQAAPRYVYLDLGTLGESTWSNARGINNSGQVVGESGTDAFIKKPGQPMQVLTTYDPGTATQAFAINNAGLVCGGIQNDEYAEFHAFLKDLQAPSQIIQDLGDLGGTWSTAYSINDAGQVVGASEDSAYRRRAFLINPGGEMQDLGTLGGTESSALGINDSGKVVGWAKILDGSERAFSREPGPDQPLQNLGTMGGNWSEAYGINKAGQVVGVATNTANLERAFLKNPSDEGMHDLGIPGTRSKASGINNSGQVVGTRWDYASGHFSNQASFLWENGISYDLKDVTVNLPEGIILFAVAINDRGWIIGNADNGRAFLLMPLKGNPSLGLLLQE